MGDFGTAVMWMTIAAYVLLSLLAITFIPSRMSPVRQDAEPEERVKTLDLQNKIRQTVIQVTAGFGFVFSIFMAVKAQESSNRDLKAKYDSGTAELFIKSTEAKNPEALYTLAYIARRDKENYHQIVYEMISSLIKSTSRTACGEDANSRIAALSKIQVAMQLLHERNASDDADEGKYNVEYSCLNGIDLGVEKALRGRYHGLAGVRLSGSQLLHVDLTRTELQRTEFMGIDAGDWRNPGWEREEHRFNLHDINSDGGLMWSALRRKYIAHFVDTNLTGARFNGAGLEGADFSGAVLDKAEFNGANISRTNFRGASGLTIDQLMLACVGRSDDKASHTRDQPVFDGTLREEIAKRGGVRAC